ncbi:general secretion pathway protein B [Duganella sp. SG902]|uniref:general secretion pathway protein GspB n=1 Tax=Duganella sp. SG902 TaxID=2587016 RepID=UPI00159D14B1|nr:general secretion pathway protein GspB [Duganella sp. SG902]NVM76596.1 general secretion pathway protein B [Duganella sp. SG902]
MSYILEALKKAQAERQLGSSPTIHAPTLQAADTASATGRFSKPLVLAVLAMAAVIAVLLAMVLKPAAQPQPAPAPAAAAPPAVQAAQPPAPAAPTPLPAPVADLPPSVANLARASAPENHSQPAAAPAPAPAPASASAPIKLVAVPEEPVVNLRDLPEPIQRAIPPVTVGGYIYSRNAADRVLLVDKVLRHEGEEVAPGLLLEKLQQKEAVFNFRGYRYRVPY